jgi:ADP-heptose:LPS heptosyltransferase
MEILFITRERIGEVVLSTPLLVRLLQSHPTARVDIVTGARTQELFEGLPNVRRNLALPPRQNWLARLRLLKDLRRRQYDLVVDLNVRLLLHFLNKRRYIAASQSCRQSHMAEQFASLWPSAKPLEPRVWLTQRLVEAAQRRLKQGAQKPLIGLGATAYSPYKRWPQKNFYTLVQQLAQQPALAGVRVALFGAAHDAPQVAALKQRCPADQLIDLVGLTTVGEVAAHIAQCDLFVGNEGGLMHLAAVQGVPTVALYGPGDDACTGPLGAYTRVVAPQPRPARQLNLPRHARPRAMTDLSVEQVLSNVLGLWEDTSPQREKK